MRTTLLAVAALAAAFASAGCSSYESRGAPLASIFPKLRTDVMSEEAIARALDTPVDLCLPSRVLVVSSDELTGSYDRGTAHRLAARVADELAESAYFLPTLSMPLDHVPYEGSDPVLPIQRLREKAARYRTPYALITFADFTGETAATPLALLYAPLVTLLFVPGERVDAHGVLQTVLLDVRTGVIVNTSYFETDASDFFVRVGHTYEAREALERKLIASAGKELAKKVDRAAQQALKLRGASTRPAPARVG